MSVRIYLDLKSIEADLADANKKFASFKDEYVSEGQQEMSDLCAEIFASKHVVIDVPSFMTDMVLDDIKK